MEVAIAEPKIVGFEELYDDYLKEEKDLKLDADVPNKSPDRMVIAYVNQPEIKKKWNDVKTFLMAHRYKSEKDACLSFETIYRSIVNGTCLRKKDSQKRSHLLEKMHIQVHIV